MSDQQQYPAAWGTLMRTENFGGIQIDAYWSKISDRHPGSVTSRRSEIVRLIPQPDVDRMVRKAKQRGRDVAAEVYARGAMELRHQILADVAREVDRLVCEAEQRGRDQERERFRGGVRVMRSQLIRPDQQAAKILFDAISEWINSGEQPGEGGDA